MTVATTTDHHATTPPNRHKKYNEKMKPVQVRFDQETIDGIDGTLRHLESRSEKIRKLVKQGLDGSSGSTTTHNDDLKDKTIDFLLNVFRKSAARIGDVDVPDNIEDFILRRLERLSKNG